MGVIDSNTLYWDRVRGYVSEHRIDARWVLRDIKTNRPCGSLRIVSHPDIIRPGYLRSYFVYVYDEKEKGEMEIIKTIEDYQLEEKDLEVYSVDKELKTKNEELEETPKELERIYGVTIF